MIEYFFRSHMKTRQDYWINAQSAHLAQGLLFAFARMNNLSDRFAKPKESLAIRDSSIRCLIGNHRNDWEYSSLSLLLHLNSLSFSLSFYIFLRHLFLYPLLFPSSIHSSRITPFMILCVRALNLSPYVYIYVEEEYRIYKRCTHTYMWVYARTRKCIFQPLIYYTHIHMYIDELVYEYYTSLYRDETPYNALTLLWCLQGVMA